MLTLAKGTFRSCWTMLLAIVERLVYSTATMILTQLTAIMLRTPASSATLEVSVTKHK